jgi:Fur family ferric uptake transcriptional regulator
MTDRIAVFHQWLKERGLKSTSQRDDIAQVFFAISRHISVEELYFEVRKINPRVGYATVYRTLKLLKECGLAAERHFADGEARFENVKEEDHHDHLLCDRCGKIVEFTHPQLERLQNLIAQKLGFIVSYHKMEIYGICRECREGRDLSDQQEKGVHQL